MNKLFPRFESIAPDQIYGDLTFPVTSRQRPYIAINVVTTVDGKATNLLGKAYTLGSSVDRVVMRRIRCAADGVLNGAETLRRENVNPGVPRELEPLRASRGLSRQPLALTLTASCNLPLDRTFLQSPEFDRVVVTTQYAPTERVAALARHARILRAGEHAVDLPLMMRLLVDELGVRRLVVEGGPTLNAELISLGLADELFWTVAPKILAGPAERTMVEESPLAPEERPGMELISVHEHESELYLRYRFVRPA
jgi:2,5-diamino-6-(ribosylamino)-4(3H)-pyrimidinone 5'-phosphate reductase